MSWFKVDDRLPTSRKLLRIPRNKRTAAIGLWTIAGAWSAHDLTDGFIPAYMIEEWGGTETDADELIRAGMWKPDERDGDTGYQFVNWDEYQPMKADVEAKREYERERKRQQRRDSNGKFAGQGDVPNLSHRDNTGTPTGQRRDSAVPVPARPVPPPSSAPKRASKLPDSWAPTPEHQEQAAQAGINIALEADKMRDWALSKGETRKDWDATFRNWIRNARPTPGYTPKPPTGQRVLQEWELRG